MLLENQSRKRRTIQQRRLPRIFSSKILKFRAYRCGGTWPEKDGRLACERKYLCWAKSKGFAKKHAKLTAEYLDNFSFADECPKYLFHYPNPKNDATGKPIYKSICSCIIQMMSQTNKFNNYSSSPNGLWVNSPWGRRPNGLLTQGPREREE